MKKLLVLNGSPKKRKSQTTKFLSELLINFSDKEYEIDIIYLYELNYSEYLFQQIAGTDILILGTPLYIDCLPTKVIELMEGLEIYKKEGFFENAPECYLVINCGYMEHEQNEVAIKIVENYFSQIGYNFRQAISIGSGAMILETKDRNLVEKGMRTMSRVIQNTEKPKGNIGINVAMPKFIFIAKADKVWLDAAKKREMTKEDLKKQPY